MAFVFVLTLLFATVVPRASAAGQQVIQQLRICEVFDHSKQAFHERFHNHALRIMGQVESLADDATR